MPGSLGLWKIRVPGLGLRSSPWNQSRYIGIPVSTRAPSLLDLGGSGRLGVPEVETTSAVALDMFHWIYGGRPVSICRWPGWFPMFVGWLEAQFFFM